MTHNDSSSLLRCARPAIRVIGLLLFLLLENADKLSPDVCVGFSLLFRPTFYDLMSGDLTVRK